MIQTFFTQKCILIELIINIKICYYIYYISAEISLRLYAQLPLMHCLHILIYELHMLHFPHDFVPFLVMRFSKNKKKQHKQAITSLHL